MKFLTWYNQIRQYLRKHNIRANHEALKLRYRDTERKPNRKQCADIVSLIDAKQYRNYKPAYGRALVLSVDYPNLEAFTKKILDTSSLVLQERPVPAGWIKLDEQVVPFDRLFVSNDGFYLDVANTVTKFQTAALRLCELMEASDTASHGIYEHNFRMLTRLFIQLREVSTSLLEVSLQR